MAVFMLSKLALAAFLLYLQLSTPTTAFELEKLAEMKCLNPEPATTAKLDQKWAQSVGTWYYVHMSQLEIYSAVAEAQGVPINQVEDEDVYYKACAKFIWGPEVKFEALGKDIPLEFTPNPNGTFHWKYNGKTEGLATIPLTDNKSYIFVYGCWPNGYASWAAMGATKELSEEAVKEIHEYAKKLGFLEKHFTFIRYGTCPKE